MTKKLTGLLLAAILILAMLAACGKSGSSSSSQSSNSESKQEPVSQSSEETKPEDAEPAPVTIKIANWPKSNDEAGLAAYGVYEAKMKELYPYITIEKDEWGYDVNSFLPKATSGQLPTLFDTYFTETQKIIDAGYARDISDALEKYGYLDAIKPELLDLVSSGGKVYGIPSLGYYMGLMINVPLFEEAGLVNGDGSLMIPANLDEVVEYAKTIKEKTGKSGFFFPTKTNQGGWIFTGVAWSFGAEFVEKQSDGRYKAVFNSPQAVEALQYISDLKWVHNVLPDNILVDINDLAGLFGTDQVGMAFGLQDWSNLLVATVGMSKDNISMASIPDGPKGPAPIMGGGAYMLSPTATDEQVDAVFKWLEVIGFTPKINDDDLAGLEEKYKSWNENNYLVTPPALRVWINEDRVAAEDKIYDKYTNVDLKFWNDYFDNGAEGMRPEVPVNAQELYQILDSVLQEALTNKNADLQKLLDDAAANFQSNYLDKLA